MKIMIDSATGAILDASNTGAWDVPDFAVIVEVPGDAETYQWPHDNGPSSCSWDGQTVIASAPLVVPASVTPLQARRALRAAGLLPTVNAWVANQPDDDIKDAWEFAGVIERYGPITQGAALALGLTEDQLDSLFISAASL